MHNIKGKMIKILCIALLLALTCQLQLTHNLFNNLNGKSFNVIANAMNAPNVNGVKAVFNNSTLSFTSSCGTYTTNYSLPAQFAIRVERSWKVAATPTTCGQRNDKLLKDLISMSVKYKLTSRNNGFLLQFFDSAGTLVLNLLTAWSI